MAYSESKKTLDKIRPDLAQLEAGNACTWKLDGTISARRYAYKVREALYIAALYPTDYPQLAKYGPYFAIEVVDKDTVQARPKPGNQTQVSILPQVSSSGSGAVVTQGLANQGTSPDELMGPQTALSVVDGWARIGAKNHKVRYPQAALTHPELVRIYEWSRRQEPVVLMFVTPTGGLTLKHRQADHEENLAWSPEDDA